MGRSIAARLVLVSLPGVPALQQPADRVVLRDVHVVTMEPGAAQAAAPGQAGEAGVLAHHDVWIEGGRIAALRPTGAAVPAGATLVEGQGRWLLPGLFDVHVHLNEGEEELLALWLASGVTTVQSMHGGPYQLALRERVARGELRGPRILTTGPTTAERGVHEVAEAERFVLEQAEAGFDALKQYGDGRNTMPLETYRALVARAHERGLRVVGHAPRNLPFDVVLEARQDSIDHMEEILYTHRGFAQVVGPYVALQFGAARLEEHPELPRLAPDLRALLADEIEELALALARTGMAITPTLVTFGRICEQTDARLLERLRDPELVYAHPLERREWAPERNRFRAGGWSVDLPFFSSWLQRAHDLQLAMTAAFRAAGVPILAGTDAPFPLIAPGSTLHDELALFVASGFTPRQALEAATLAPARALRVERDSGSIAAGKRADLVLVEASPLADVGNARRVAGLVLAGRWIPRAELQAPLAVLAARHAAVEERLPPLLAALEAQELSRALELLAPVRHDRRLAEHVRETIDAAGREHLQHGRVDQAVETLSLNADAFPEAAGSWTGLAEALAVSGAFDEAIALYERALELAPDDDAAQERLAALRARAGG